MKRGQVWWVDLGDPPGSEPGFRRPVLIVQEDLLTDSLLSTVMVAPLTSNMRRGLAIGNVEILANESGLSKPSVALVCQVSTADKSFFTDRVGTLSATAMAKVDRGLTLALGIGSTRIRS